MVIKGGAETSPSRVNPASTSGKPVIPYAIFAMAGQSIRFLDAGYQLPKYMLSLGSTPMFSLAALPFEGEGFENYFVCNDEALDDSNLQIRWVVREHFPSSNIISTPKNKLGPSYSLLCSGLGNLELSRPVILSYTDAFSSFSPRELLTRMFEVKADAAAVAFKGSHHPASQFGNSFAYLKTRGSRVESVSEKISFTDNPGDEFASTGVYAFRNLETMMYALEKQVEDSEKYNGEFYTSLALNSLVKRNRKVILFETDHFIDVGTPNSYEEFRRNAAIYFSSKRCQEKDSGNPLANAEATIVLAAGRGLRFELQGFSKAKPNLPLGAEAETILESLFRHTVSPIASGKIVLAVSERVRQEWSLLEHARWCGRGDIALVPPTGSSLETLKFALASAPNRKRFHVLACDVVIDAREIQSQFAEFSDTEGFFLWVGRPTSISRKMPELFSWVELDDDGNVTKVLVKAAPDCLENPFMILGSFSYLGTLNQLLGEVDRLLQSSRGPNELHMEDLVAQRIQKGQRVTGIVMRNFISVGSPVELSHAQYYLDFLGKLPIREGS